MLTLLVGYLALKLIVTPLLVAAASFAGRRWGPAVSGWLVALPLTSGPIVFFLSLSQGEEFAAAVAGATLIGAISQAAFCLGYSGAALRRPSPIALLIASLAFFAATLLLQQIPLSAILSFLLVVLSLAIAIRLMPRFLIASAAPVDRRPPPLWDIPVRVIVTTAFVLLLTAGAPALGAKLTGLLAPFPLYGAILAVFAHHQHGAESAVQVLRGLLFGLFSFAGFFLALALLLCRVEIIWSFAAAIVVALAIQAGTLWALRRQRRTSSEEALFGKG